ncbi:MULTISPECIES: PEP-CTERM sorting domain-containing protein [unclassified Nodularia (in: cyanobacteria)]|uniref:PEP-CTERM sorting domain-containing protein n=1 Tax=unclassified Nodularia (in: cyanobacteria) TaxID=2656917 RepID=UPI001D104A2E|nr:MULTISPECIES: PEP-CTERM sorting domain-containing protein [unclassified Nodularia (in: cyanobacteria)]MCC2693639.1 PEP-CTERM sorting domain-containing protein [Nodularia sp. LEGE 04288]
MKHLSLLFATALAVTSGLMFGTMQAASAACVPDTAVCNDALIPPNDSFCNYSDNPGNDADHNGNDADNTGNEPDLISKVCVLDIGPIFSYSSTVNPILFGSGGVGISSFPPGGTQISGNQLSPITVPEPSSIFSLLALGTLSASFVLKRHTNSL